MAISILSKNIYNKDNQKVRSNIINNIEVDVNNINQTKKELFASEYIQVCDGRNEPYEKDNEENIEFPQNYYIAYGTRTGEATEYLYHIKINDIGLGETLNNYKKNIRKLNYTNDYNSNLNIIDDDTIKVYVELNWNTYKFKVDNNLKITHDDQYSTSQEKKYLTISKEKEETYQDNFGFGFYFPEVGATLAKYIFKLYYYPSTNKYSFLAQIPYKSKSDTLVANKSYEERYLSSFRIVIESTSYFEPQTYSIKTDEQINNKYLFKLNSNELFQSTNSQDGDAYYIKFFNDITKKWGNGKETATIRCSISDYYDYITKEQIIGTKFLNKSIISTSLSTSRYFNVLTFSVDKTYNYPLKVDFSVPVNGIIIKASAFIEKGLKSVECLFYLIDEIDENGLNILSVRELVPMSFKMYDQVIPMVYGADGKDRPMSTYQDGSAKVFQVLGSNIYYDGAVWQELSLQEVDKSEIL